MSTVGTPIPTDLVAADDPILRQRAQIVNIDDGLRQRCVFLLELMQQHKAHGLAAPQLGWSERFFVVTLSGQFVVAINPVIRSKRGTQVAEEGCLSLPNVFVKVRRARHITVEAYDYYGKLFVRKLSDLNARIWQHEQDHLDGRLITDYRKGT